MRLKNVQLVVDTNNSLDVGLRASMNMKIFSKITFAILLISSLCSDDTFFLDHAIVGVYAVKNSTGEVLVEKNSELSLTPASCLKIATTAAALHILGPNYRFETYLEIDGWVDDKNTLHGNLYIRGGGDPCLGSKRIAGALSWEEQIETWVLAIKERGICKIEGKVIGDATKWEKALAVPSWTWEDLGNYYGAGASALSFHENCYSLFFKPGDTVGAKTTILRTDFPLPILSFQNEVVTGPEGSGDGACIYGSEFSSLQFIRGTIPAGVSEFAIKGAISDPAASCANLLEKKIEEMGIVIEKQDINFQKKRECIHTTYSPTVQEIVYVTNQKSLNLYAEHLLKKMGEVVYKEGSTAAGVKAVADFWRSRSIDLGGFNMVDGSGLSRKNLVTAKQLVSMLLKMKQSDVFLPFLNSLPQVENLIRGKSGTMSLVKGYTGYIGDVTFAILVNQCTDFKASNKCIKDFFIKLDQLSQKTAE